MSLIHFQVQGHGKPIILLHGFPMNQTVWDDFVPLLSDTHKVITVDLPGFGKSPSLPLPFTIEQVADSVLSWMSAEKFFGGTLIGHSLGGYVALAMAEKAPAVISGLGLFHSTAYADSADKKESRLKVIDFIEKNGVLAFTSNFIPPLFADQNHKAISKVREIAIQSSKNAVLGYTLAMRNRPDRTAVLQKLKIPVLFLAGEADAGIPVESIIKQADQCELPLVHILKQVAHMGMFEDPQASAAMIRSFENH
jgi:pimeloyl-ACP methyl ester carboxylesterase